MDSLLLSSASRLQSTSVAATLEQRQTLQAQIEEQRARAQTLAAEQRLADRTARDINEARFDREIIRSTTDANRIAATRVQEADDLRILERQDRAVDDNLRALDNQLTREAIRDAFNPLPGLPQNRATPASESTVESLPVRTDEISLRELLVDRNARLTDRAADEQSFTQQQSRDFSQSVNAIETLFARPDDAPTLEERGAIVDFQA